MSEELETTEVQQEPTQEPEAPQINPLEQKAMEQGWRPQEQWEGDPNEWVDARTFVKNGEFMGRIHQQNRQIKELHKAMDDMKSLLSSAENRGRKAALDELKAAKIKALEHGDYAKAEELADKIEETRQEHKETTVKQEVDPYTKYAQDHWFSQNDWYNKDAELKDEFDELIYGYVAKHGASAAPEEAFDAATKKLKRMYPEKFSSGKRQPTQSVAPATTTTRPAKPANKKTWADLTEDQRRVGDRFVRLGHFTREEYIAELQKEGDL